MTIMTNDTFAAREIDSASLDQVVGGAVLHEARGGTGDLRKQEETDKLNSEESLKSA